MANHTIGAGNLKRHLAHFFLEETRRRLLLSDLNPKPWASFTAACHQRQRSDDSHQIGASGQVNRIDLAKRL